MPVEVLGVIVTTSVFLGLSCILLIAERYIANYGTVTITINEGFGVLENTGGKTLLNILYDGKIFIPSACGGKGSCGYCKVIAKEGAGPVLPTETPFLTREELRRGTRLACQVKVKQNVSITLPEEYLSVSEFAATVLETRSLTYDIKELTFKLNQPQEIKYRPGQYVQVLARKGSEQVFRAYSISSPEYVSDRIELIVRLVPGGIASTYIHGLEKGDEVVFTGPYGEFKLDDNPEVPVVCVGGGAGMAPIKSIIHSIYRKWPSRKCFLFFGCRSTRDLFYHDEYTAMARQYPDFKVFYALSDPLGQNDAWDGEVGFIHLALDKHLQDGSRVQAFLCGPPPMIDAVTSVLKAKNTREANIFYDKF